MIAKSKLIKVLFSELLDIGAVVNKSDRSFLIWTRGRTEVALYLIGYFGFKYKNCLDLGDVLQEFKITDIDGSPIDHECKFIKS